MNKKDTLVVKVNDLLKKSDINVKSYRKYVTSAGKNVKFLLKVIDKKEYPELYKYLTELKKM